MPSVGLMDFIYLSENDLDIIEKIAKKQYNSETEEFLKKFGNGNEIMKQIIEAYHNNEKFKP